MCSGFSLIEVMISFLLLALILFGFDAMEVYSLHQMQQLFSFSTATNQLSNMAERLQAIREEGDLSEQIEQWNQENANLLPHSYGQVSGNFPDYTITLFWGKQQDQCKKNPLGESGCWAETIHLG